MAEELRLEYLGGMQITRDETPLDDFVSAKAPALLCYLAIVGRPQFRLVLAGLLWGDLPEEDACANLRKVLSNLRSLIGRHLVITPQKVAFNRQSSYWLDVELFLDRAQKGMGRQGNPKSLHEAADLYRGDFLEGFYLRRAPAFEEWVLAQREQLRQSALRIHQLLASYHAGREEYTAAIDYTSRLLALDPWQEEAHRQMMTLLARSGQRSAALAQYESCRRLLAEDLGIEPMAETAALCRRIRAIGAPRPNNLPAPATSFVGREAELAQVSDRLAEPGCRLLSILGPGGVGKTRLALQSALALKGQVNDRFLDGIYFVSLHPVQSASGLVSALAGSLGLVPVPGTETQAELLRHLHAKDLLLVLDGFEHLVGEASLLSAILQHASQVKLLVTSRQRLNLCSEWLLELGGLPYAPLGTPAGIETYGATQLFLQRAQQACPNLKPSAMDYQAITFICELVEGLPLAIELAAAWAKAMCCLDIARAIESGLDVLTAFPRDQPARHQSMRAAFEHSWNLLSTEERRVFRKMAVFDGGLDREAAERVAGADLTMLTALADKSLLRRSLSGRYEIHELLRQFAREKLKEVPTESEEVAARHARHYLSEFIARRERELAGGAQKEALAHFKEEIGNVHAAWCWMTTNGKGTEIGRALDGLVRVAVELGEWDEVERMLGESANSFTAPDAQVAAARARCVLGQVALAAGRHALARRLLEEGLPVLQDSGNTALALQCQTALEHIVAGLDVEA